MRADITFDNCDSVSIWLVTEPPASTQVIVHRKTPPLIRPKPAKRIRDLVPGDTVVFGNEDRVVERIEPYR